MRRIHSMRSRKPPQIMPPCNRQQGRDVAQVQLDLVPHGCNWSRIHNHELSAFLANLWPRHIGRYKIPKDSIVIPALHHIHNNPDLWDNPQRYSPDRWDTEEVKNRHKAAYIPFATGPRICIGFNFALQEIKVFLPKLVYRYNFTREGVGPIEYGPMFQLIGLNNLYVRAERRVKWPPKTSDLGAGNV